MQLIADGKAPKIVQTEEGATYDAMMRKDNAEVSVAHLHIKIGL